MTSRYQMVLVGRLTKWWNKVTLKIVRWESIEGLAWVGKEEDPFNLAPMKGQRSLITPSTLQVDDFQLGNYTTTGSGHDLFSTKVETFSFGCKVRFLCEPEGLIVFGE